MKALASAAQNLSQKLAWAMLAIACLLIGLVGIVLPVIPGLLFLIFAAVAAARLSSRVDAWLRKLPAAGSYLNQSSRFFRLSFLDKCRYCFWLTLQLTVDTVRVSWHLLGRAARRINGRGDYSKP